MNESNILHFYRIKENKLRFVFQPVIIAVRLVNEREEKIIKLLFFFLKKINVKLLIIPDWNVPLCLEIFRLARASVWLLLLFRLRGRRELSK